MSQATMALLSTAMQQASALPPKRAGTGIRWRCAVIKLIICIGLTFTTLETANVAGAWNLEMEWPSSGSRSTGVCQLKQHDISFQAPAARNPPSQEQCATGN